ncbi:MAG: transcription elongation factor GreB [Polyangiales bacterium]
MSKAFTKESDGSFADAGDAAVDEEIEVAAIKTAYITRAGYLALQAELDRLWKVDRPKITQEVAWAAAQGDRSENAEYIYGKKKLREIDRRIRFLSKRLDALTIVEPSPEQEGRAFFGATVTFEDEDGVAATYRIVGPDETDSGKRWISIESPVARALLGKREGDEALVARPKGPTTLTIVAIVYETS